MWPDESKRQTPQPWVLYSPTLPRYPDQNEKWIHEQFLNAGVAVAGIDVGEAYGSPEGQKHFSALYKELTENRGFAKRACLLGRSRGGLGRGPLGCHLAQSRDGDLWLDRLDHRAAAPAAEPAVVVHPLAPAGAERVDRRRVSVRGVRSGRDLAAMYLPC